MHSTWSTSGPLETVPEKFRERRLYQHNPTVTLMRTTPEERPSSARSIAQKRRGDRRPTAVRPAARRVTIDREGQPFWSAGGGPGALPQAQQTLAPGWTYVELDLDINDPAFAHAMGDTLHEHYREGAAREVTA